MNEYRLKPMTLEAYSKALKKDFGQRRLLKAALEGRGLNRQKRPERQPCEEPPNGGERRGQAPPGAPRRPPRALPPRPAGPGGDGDSPSRAAGAAPRAPRGPRCRDAAAAAAAAPGPLAELAARARGAQSLQSRREASVEERGWGSGGAREKNPPLASRARKRGGEAPSSAS
ncbi:spidroin-2-like [Zalophus californianus]|uniref:Spidroin-2-like n=1 Tax=Zalophus californianus TaxID=9704 RepID=A0A6P9F6K2_ZALCA|nr:spidroin-2-like [Eumetopias jubatus]XP_035582750.1 spidroin-2-like [Zalophus californianus]